MSSQATDQCFLWENRGCYTVHSLLSCLWAKWPLEERKWREGLCGSWFQRVQWSQWRRQVEFLRTGAWRSRTAGWKLPWIWPYKPHPQRAPSSTWTLPPRGSPTGEHVFQMMSCGDNADSNHHSLSVEPNVNGTIINSRKLTLHGFCLLESSECIPETKWTVPIFRIRLHAFFVKAALSCSCERCLQCGTQKYSIISGLSKQRATGLAPQYCIWISCLI